MNSFKFIHCFLPTQAKRFLSFTCNSLFKYINMEIFIHRQLAKIRPSSVKIWRMDMTNKNIFTESNFWAGYSVTLSS